MKKVFIYPISRGTQENPGNQYINCFSKSFSDTDKYVVINRSITGKEILDFIFNIDANLFIFNWIEGIVFTLSGKIQFLFVTLYLLTLRLLGKDVIWVFHNKRPHKGETAYTRFAMKMMAHLSSKVITHSSLGVTCFKELYPDLNNKCFYLPHPVYSTDIVSTKEIIWDYIIWGEVNPRKGIYEFLCYANSREFYKDKKILICGLCRDEEYSEKIRKLCNSNITFINRFVFDYELSDWISKSNVILFTYSSDSVLSSGSLIYSLNYCKPIIGPNVGNFVDMKGVANCYNTFSDIENMKLYFDSDLCLNYIKENQWKYIPKKIENILNNDYENT